MKPLDKSYLYQGVTCDTYVTQCSPRTFSEREACIGRNVEFETDGISRGVERYRNEISKDISKFSDTGRSAWADSDVGSKLLDQAMRPLVKGLHEDQQEASLGFSRKGHSAIWWLPLLCLRSDTLAAVILRTVLAGLQPEVAASRPWTSCALLIGRNIKIEREFELWKDRQYKAAKDGAVNLYKVMTRSCRKIDQRAVRRFMRQSMDLDRLDWSKEVRLHLGMKCLDTLVQHGNGWFECQIIGKGYGTNRHVEKSLKISSVARQAIEDDHKRCELNRPFLLPMLTEPVSWRWHEGAKKSSGKGIAEPKIQAADSQIAQALRQKFESGRQT